MKFKIKIDTYKATDSAMSYLDENSSDETCDAFFGELKKFFPNEEIVLEFDTETKTATIAE
jgi:hypothetical protein